MKNLNENEIFVFGSNTQGRHGRGAAKTALDYFGAVYGVGRGMTGQCYAIPTCYWFGKELKQLLLKSIQKSINDFIEEASKNQDLTFVVTRIGCGLAGFKDEQIAPLFKEAPENCIFSPKWKPFLPEHFKFDERLF